MSDEREQVSWNIASYMAVHVFNLVRDATNKYLKGDIGGWYWTLTALRDMLNCDLRKEEREFFDAAEKKANAYSSSWDKYHKMIIDSMEPGQQLKEDKLKFAATVKLYERDLMDMLKELGYMPSKEDRGKLGY